MCRVQKKTKKLNKIAGWRNLSSGETVLEKIKFWRKSFGELSSGEKVLEKKRFWRRKGSGQKVLEKIKFWRKSFGELRLSYCTVLDLVLQIFVCLFPPQGFWDPI